MGNSASRVTKSNTRPMHPLKKFFLVFLIAVLTASSLGLLWISDKYVVPILMYHHVDFIQPAELNYVNPDNFEYHMRYLAEHGYKVISLSELVKSIKSGSKLNKKSVVVTFDDGYADLYKHAFGTLKKYRVPAIIFMPSDLVGTKGFLSKEQLREMNQHGIEIGSHSRTHAYLPETLRLQQRDEIIESKRILEREFGVKVAHFAYPNGGFNNQVKQFIEDAGYESACTTNRGEDRLNKDVYELKRIRLSDKDNKDFYLWAKFSGYYNLFRKSTNPY